jgi:hypothetical protein
MLLFSIFRENLQFYVKLKYAPKRKHTLFSMKVLACLIILCCFTRFAEKTFGLVSVILYKGDFIMESLINCDFLDEARILDFITTTT